MDFTPETVVFVYCVVMNALLPPDAFHRTRIRRPQSGSFIPDLMDQVVAGILWMSLDLPEDVSRGEVETLAHQLVIGIRAGLDNAALEQKLASLQLEKFCLPPIFVTIRQVVQRVRNVVGGF